MTRWAVLLLPVLGLLAKDPWGGPDDHAIKYVILSAGAFVCVALSLPVRRLAWSPVSIALWAFVAVRGVMLFRSPMPPRSLRWWLLLVALAFVHHAALAAAPRDWLKSRAPLVLGGLAGALGLYALGQRLCGAPLGYATFANSNFAGAGLAMLLPFALLFPGRWRVALAAACVLGLLATKSRGGALAAAVAVAVLVGWAHRSVRWPLVVGLPLVALLVGIGLGRSETVEVRLTWYRAAFAMGLDHPVLGLGADGFAREYPPVRPAREWNLHKGAAVHSVHDDYLESFSDGGLLGLAAHVFLLVAAALSLRRERAALASLAAFAAASLVDLPLQDPSLLALVLFPLALADRKTRARGVLPATFVALLAIGYSLATDNAHWRADRALGRFIVTRDRKHLDFALSIEPDHAGALLRRSGAEDLSRVLAFEPHHGDALCALAVRLPAEEAILALEQLLRRHDPHHAAARKRLRELRDADAERRARAAEPLIATDALRAASVLEAIAREKPDTWVPYLLLARLYRSDDWLREAEARGSNEEIADVRLALEYAALGEGEAHLAGIARAAGMLSADGLRERIDRHLAAAAAALDAGTPPELRPEEGEDPAAFAERLLKAKVAWRAAIQKKTMPDCVVARVLAEELVRRAPTAPHMHLLARAVRGQGEVERAAQFEAVALFLETLDAIDQGDDQLARRRYERALRAYPKLAEERVVQDALRLFVQGNEERRRRVEALGLLK